MWWITLSMAATVSAGQSHTCSLQAPGAPVHCWGGATVEQLRSGDGSPRKVPQVVAGLPAAVDVSAGGRGKTCAVSTDREVWCWELGERPVRVQAAPSDAVDVEVGGAHACALTSSGAVHCWGDDARDQLGGGAPVPGLPPVRALSAGEQHTCAVAATGEVWCWGGNAQGQLGRDETSATLPPGPVVFLQDAVGIAAGGFHSCAVRRGGEVVCWGDNLNGQLGDGSRTRSSVVVAPRAVEGVVQLAAGFGHTCAVTRSGALWCWGASDRGQLGTPSKQDQLLPAAVRGVSGATAVGAGQQHTCVVVGGEVHCMGANLTSQLGDGGTERRHELRPVAQPSSGDVAR